MKMPWKSIRFIFAIYRIRMPRLELRDATHTMSRYQKNFSHKFSPTPENVSLWLWTFFYYYRVRYYGELFSEKCVHVRLNKPK